MKIGLAERKLLAAVEAGQPALLGWATIQAELIRRLVLGLPVRSSAWATVRRLVSGAAPTGHALTPVGISIRNAVIAGDLDLSSAIGEAGGPMCPLAFEQCRFEGRFIGAHARFGRLSFAGSNFVDSGVRRDDPTIELSGAAIDSDLHMRGIHPCGTREGDRDEPIKEDNYLTVRLNGARVDGEIDLCCSYLRARPPEPDEEAPEIDVDDNDSLDLTLAEVRGDLQFLRARSEGRIKIRTSHIAGDVWMTGANLGNSDPHWLRGQALLIQGTRIDGFLMLDGGFEKSDGTGEFNTFTCQGTLKLEAAEIGRSLYLEDAVVAGSIAAPFLQVHDDLLIHADVSGDIDLAGCRVGGSLDVSRLNLAAPAGKVTLRDGSIGRTLRIAPPRPVYRFVGGRERTVDVTLSLKLVETLWRIAEEERDKDDEEIPARCNLVRAAFLVVGRWGRFARVYHLDGHEEVIDRAKARLPGKRLSEGNRQALGELAKTYVLTGPRPAMPDSASGRLENGLFVLPRRSNVELATMALADDWFPDGAWDAVEGSRALVRRFAGFVRSKPLLQARFDLDGLSCDMLEDGGGWAWGNHSDRIRMNHFVYRRADWRAEPIVARRTRTAGRWYRWLKASAAAFARDRSLELLSERWAKRPQRPRVTTKRTRSSFQRLLDWGKGVAADELWLPRKAWLAALLREESDYISPWQVRRNWIYRQFTSTPNKPRHLVSNSRYRIVENEYRPQPFEQAIAVARAEGREELAVQFEMLKKRIEWRLFNEWIRWPLAFVAIILAAIWLWYQGGNPLATLAALMATLAFMTFISRIDNWFRWAWYWVRRVLRELFLYFPAILLLLTLDNWHEHPFYFIIAFLIFVSIRSIAAFASAAMRFGFGYLRRPARAIATLIAAFLIGWWGVSVANSRDMLVIASEPAAHVAAPEKKLDYPYKDPKRPHLEEVPLIVGTLDIENDPAFVGEISCAPTASEPLYALDVLIPLVDLHEESRCEIRRVPECGPNPAPTTKPHLPIAGKLVAAPERRTEKTQHCKPRKRPAEMGFWELWQRFPAFMVEDHRFWWWMKALYAIAGWFIVSLALLTFAQVNRTHGEPAESS